MPSGALPSSTVTASAPAKAILFGEHAALYGQPAVAPAPALALAVELWLTLALALAVAVVLLSHRA